LSLNYRTTEQIMDVAADVLREIDEGLTAPVAVRKGESAPWSLPVADLLDELPALVKEELAVPGVGRLAIIVPQTRMAELGPALAQLDGIRFADDPAALDAPVVVLTPVQSKGLEFDAVLVLDPQQILAESPTGTRDLYVAITRATQRLGILHLGELPGMLGRVRSSSTG
jgi:DNA helicase IV